MVAPRAPSPDEPDDPFDLVDPNDPNLSLTAPPNPANMRRPENAEPHWTWYVLSQAEGAGMSPSWHITSVLTSGVPGQAFASYSSWEEAFAAYSRAYRANAVRILPGRRIRRSCRRRPGAQRRPQPTPGSTYANLYVIPSSLPTTPQRPAAQHTSSATPGTTRSNPYHVASSPAPATPTRPSRAQPRVESSLAPVTPTPAARSQRMAPGSAARLRAIEEALSDGNPATPTPTHDNNDVRSRIRALEQALEAYLERDGSQLSPQTPTAANSSITSRLDTLETTMSRILAREAACESMQSRLRSLEDGRDVVESPLHRFEILDGRDPTPSPSYRFLDGRDPTPPRMSFSAAPVAGSSTGPGTLAWEAARAHSAGSAHDDDDDDDDADADADTDDSDDGNYVFYDFTAEEDMQVQELLMSYHEEYRTNQ